MDKKQKGLADTGDAEFILNESGTSVSIDKTEDQNEKFSQEERQNAPTENTDANGNSCTA